MAGKFRNFARKLTLADLVDDTTNAFKAIDAQYPAENEQGRRSSVKFRYAINNITRGAFRVTGDLVFLTGVGFTAYDPENVLKYGAFGLAGGACFYLIEYIMSEMTNSSKAKN